MLRMKFLAMPLMLILVGCSFFAPAYVKEADTRATEAYQEISNIMSRAELGALEDKSTYSEYIDNYANAISLLETASFSIGGTPDDDAQDLLAKSLQNLNAVLNICISQVKIFASEHEEFGIDPSSGIIQPVRVSCDEAVKAIRSTK